MQIQVVITKQILMLNKLNKIFLILFLAIFLTNKADASIISGTVDSSLHFAQICETQSCTESNTSPINFGYFINTPNSNVIVNDTYLSGFIWGKSFGWSVLNCVNTISGCNAQNGNFKVYNDYDGHLSGYAWGEDSGWINFGPFDNSSASSVTINSSGEFNGYAWSQNHGWIKFDCSTSNYCVKTDWRPRNARPECSDGLDNDSDGYTDNNDSGCINNGQYDPTDNTEFQNKSGGGGILPPPPPSFCSKNPTDPSCIAPSYCTLYPSDPSCNPVIPPTFCTLNPKDPSCVKSNFCTDHPTDPSCNGQIPPTFCTLNPTDPSCTFVLPPKITPPPTKVTPSSGSQFCASHPTDISCLSNKVRNFFNKSEVKIVAETTAGIGILATLVRTAVISFFENPLSLYDMIVRFWSLLLSAIGLKKRNRPWGTVYDSVTKQPIDPAYVTIQDLNGKEIASSITDLDGRYGFLVPAGDYTITAHKTNYQFPSLKLSGHTGDELYQDLYFGETIHISEDEVIKKNIPMDQIGFDWNEFEKQKQHLLRFYSKRDLWISRISDILFILGLVLTIIAIITSPSILNYILLGVYVLIFVLRHTILKPKLFGTVASKETKLPLSFAIIRIYSADMQHEVMHKICNKMGKYYCLIPKGSYYVKIESKNLDGSYSLVHSSPLLDLKNSYLNIKFEV